MKIWIFRKGLRIYKEDAVSFVEPVCDRHGNVYFEVEDSENGSTHLVKIEENGREHCDCIHGVTEGKYARCPHKVAVHRFLETDVVDGEITSKTVLGKGAGREKEIEKTKADNELTSTQKQKLKKILSCEICGGDCDELHRLNRGQKYQLRNIQPLCKQHHKKIHEAEKGHGTR